CAGAPSDVFGLLAACHRPGVAHPELGCRLCRAHRVRDAFLPQGRARGADDGRHLRRGLPRLHAADEAGGAVALLTGWGAADMVGRGRQFRPERRMTWRALGAAAAGIALMLLAGATPSAAK